MKQNSMQKYGNKMIFVVNQSIGHQYSQLVMKGNFLLLYIPVHRIFKGMELAIVLGNHGFGFRAYS
jgi:hypothetical protein